jgi:hypothetical protein
MASVGTSNGVVHPEVKTASAWGQGRGEWTCIRLLVRLDIMIDGDLQGQAGSFLQLRNLSSSLPRIQAYRRWGLISTKHIDACVVPVCWQGRPHLKEGRQPHSGMLARSTLPSIAS